jgi:hypothetical protein
VLVLIRFVTQQMFVGIAEATGTENSLLDAERKEILASGEFDNLHKI